MEFSFSQKSREISFQMSCKATTWTPKEECLDTLLSMGIDKNAAERVHIFISIKAYKLELLDIPSPFFCLHCIFHIQFPIHSTGKLLNIEIVKN